MEKEIRVININTSKLQVEQRDDGPPKISGYAAVFNADSEDMGFIERIKPGAFKKALKKSDVRALFNHDPNHIIGRSGVNLHLKEDKTGLHMTVDPIPTETYRMVSENIQAGLVTQQSFAFTVADDEWDEDYRSRTINEIAEIFDVSPVTYPAYPDTTVALRSIEQRKSNPKEKPSPIIQVADRVIDEFIRRGLVVNPTIEQPAEPGIPTSPADDELWNRFDQHLNKGR